MACIYELFDEIAEVRAMTDWDTMALGEGSDQVPFEAAVAMIDGSINLWHMRQCLDEVDVLLKKVPPQQRAILLTQLDSNYRQGGPHGH